MIKLGACPTVMTGNHQTNENNPFHHMPINDKEAIVIPKDIDSKMPFEPAIEDPDYIMENGEMKPKKSSKRRKKKSAE